MRTAQFISAMNADSNIDRHKNTHTHTQRVAADECSVINGFFSAPMPLSFRNDAAAITSLISFHSIKEDTHRHTLTPIWDYYYYYYYAHITI